MPDSQRPNPVAIKMNPNIAGACLRDFKKLVKIGREILDKG
jgi:hypothetical protein